LPNQKSKSSTKTGREVIGHRFAISGLILRVSRLTAGKRGAPFQDKNVDDAILSDIDV